MHRSTTARRKELAVENVMTMIIGTATRIPTVIEIRTATRTETVILTGTRTGIRTTNKKKGHDQYVDRVLSCPDLWSDQRTALFRHRKTSGTHKRRRLRIATAEAAVAFGWVDGVADGENVLDQRIADLLVVSTFAFGECFPCVSRQNVRPEIAVIASRIAVT